MIMIPMDEAGAFDALSILAVKSKHGLGVDDARSNLYRAIWEQIGTTLFNTVLNGCEYADLLTANIAMWKIQEAAMRDECKASDVDKQNQVRYHAKQALQRKFFGGELTEQKSVRPYEQESSK